jgi:predicted small secreted protein
MNRMCKYLIILTLTTFSLGLTACETVDGAGRDIENAGQAVQKSSN